MSISFAVLFCTYFLDILNNVCVYYNEFLCNVWFINAIPLCDTTEINYSGSVNYATYRNIPNPIVSGFPRAL
jgi:hypothetical protein